MINLFYWNAFIIVLLLISIRFCRVKFNNTKAWYVGCAILIGILTITPLLVDDLQEKNCYSYTNKVVAGNSDDDFAIVEDVGEIIDGNIIEQTFYCEGSAIEYIRVYTTNYGRQNTGEIKIELWDKDENVLIDEWNEDISKFPDYKYVQLNVTNPFKIDNAGHTCVIKIIPVNSKAGNAISVLKVPNQYQGGELYISGNKQDADIMFNVMGYGFPENKEHARVYICIMCLIIYECYLYVKIGRKKC